MAKKGTIEEIFSKARFTDNADSYIVYYRDLERIVEKTLPKFLAESDNFQTIPVARIEKITKDGTILFEKNNKEVLRDGNS